MIGRRLCQISFDSLSSAHFNQSLRSISSCKLSYLFYGINDLCRLVTKKQLNLRAFRNILNLLQTVLWGNSKFLFTFCISKDVQDYKATKCWFHVKYSKHFASLKSEIHISWWNIHPFTLQSLVKLPALQCEALIHKDFAIVSMVELL